MNQKRWKLATFLLAMGPILRTGHNTTENTVLLTTAATMLRPMLPLTFLKDTVRISGWLLCGLCCQREKTKHCWEEDTQPSSSSIRWPKSGQKSSLIIVIHYHFEESGMRKPHRTKTHPCCILLV